MFNIPILVSENSETCNRMSIRFCTKKKFSRKITILTGNRKTNVKSILHSQSLLSFSLNIKNLCYSSLNNSYVYGINNKYSYLL